MFRAIFTSVMMMAAMGTVSPPAKAAGNAAEGATAFIVCVECHDLRPGRNMTGPSLSGIFGSKAAANKDFSRYSNSLENSHLTWDADTLDAWLANSKELVPGSRMNSSVPDAKTRADIIAYLAATQRADGRNEDLALPKHRPSSLNLGRVGPASLVVSMRLCKDTYVLTMQNGTAIKVWERDLRIKTDSSDEGPAPGAPALIQGGMHGDRPYVVFKAPQEISSFVKTECAP